MELPKLHTRLNELISAIELLLSQKYHGAALILMYSTIDILARLDRDRDHEDVKRSDYISWVETYLLPTLAIDISALDLYAARCSLLHSYSAESRLSRRWEAKELFYSWGSGKHKELQKSIDAADRDAIAVQIEDLASALKAGIESFLDSIERKLLVLERADKLFINIPV